MPTILTEQDVVQILCDVERRNEMKRELAKLSNSAIAKRHGVHRRTIDRITQGKGWLGVRGGE